MGTGTHGKAGLSESADISYAAANTYTGVWSLTPGTLYTSTTGTNQPGATCPSVLNSGQFCFALPWTNWNAFQVINHLPYLLQRDIDPASNDNGPVGLDKAA